MATSRVLKPPSQVPPIDGGPPFAVVWYRFFSDIAARLASGDVGSVIVDLTALQTQLDALTTTVSGIDGEVDALNLAITTIQTQITNLLSLIGGLGADIYAPIFPVAPMPANDMVFQPVNYFPAAAVVLPTFVDNEVPSGAIPGATFTLAHAPSPTTALCVWINNGGAFPTTDYTLAGAVITLGAALVSGDTIHASYRY